MSDYYQGLATQCEAKLKGLYLESKLELGELTLIVAPQQITELAIRLRDEVGLEFALLIDLCGVDYSEYGESKWQGERFAVVYHLLSTTMNHRIRLRCFLPEAMPVIDSVVPIWNGANWFEREAFDLFGIMFSGHPDLRRILTDYGFIGHPFRKDFPLSGHVEMRYDPEKGRVVYEPVNLEPRDQVPKRYRDDHRYIKPLTEGAQ